MKKWILSIAVTLFLVVVMLPLTSVPAFAAFSDGEMTLSGVTAGNLQTAVEKELKDAGKSPDSFDYWEIKKLSISGTLLTNYRYDNADYGFLNGTLTGITELDISGITSALPLKAFEGNSALTTIRLPANVVVAQAAFTGCTSLTTLSVGANPLISGVIDLRGATGLQWMVFKDCTSITTVKLPTIDVFTGTSTFEGCTSLSTLSVGDNTPTNGVIDFTGYKEDYRTAMFKGCTAIAAIKLLGSEIALEMFSSCTGLTQIEFTSMSPPSFGYNAFDGIRGPIAVTVPATTEEAYLAALRGTLPDGWYIKGLQSTTPTTDSLYVKKQTPESTSVELTLTNTTPYEDGLIWKVYDDSAYTPSRDVTATYDAATNKLTLFRTSPLSESEHYVTVTEIGKTESKVLAINVWHSSYTVTFEANGGSEVAPIPDAPANYAIPKPADPTKSGYTFAGWYKEPALTNAWNFASDKVTGDMTLYAKWEKDNTGSGGGYTPSIDTTKAANDIKNAPPGGTVTVKMNGKTTLPASILEAAQGKDVNVVFDFGGYTWTINGQSVTSVPAGGINMKTQTINIAHLFDLAESAGVAQLEIAYSGPLPFDGVLDYKIGDAHNGKTLYLYYYNKGNGKLEYRQAAPVQDGRIKLTFNHASQYVLTDKRIDEPIDPTDKPIDKPIANPFVDVLDSDWFYTAVMTVYGKGLFAGTAADRFDPQAAMTRGMFVTVLARLEGVDLSAYTTSVFDDVDQGSWYGKAVAWAADKGIVSGVGGGRFAPDKDMTREEMAVMLYQYMQKTGKRLPSTSNIPLAFEDGAEMAHWATEAVSAMQTCGLMQGSDKRFHPKGTATRAEVATIFMNYLNAAAQ